MKKLLCLLLIWPLMVCAGPNDADVETKQADEVYVETGQWQVSLAIGYGAKSNPLVGGDDLPLVLLPEFSYYGESFYFDNGDLGYTLVETERYSASVVTRLNFERAYFAFLHPSNILLGQTATAGDQVETPSAGDGPYRVPSIEDLSSRKYAVDGGIALNVFFDNGHMIRAEVIQDISGVHKGQNALVEYMAQQRFDVWRVSATVGLKYKSRRLVDYYYGINQSDGVNPYFYYQGNASIHPYVKVSAMYPLTERWDLVGLARWSKIGSGMADSPVVEENTESTLYGGVSYAF